MPRIIYSRHYNIRFYGLERFHPFDSRKYGRAWNELRRHFGSKLREMHVSPRRPVSRQELQLVHSESYLRKLCDSTYVARAIEIPQVARLPGWAVDWHVLRPMRWATRGTVVAAVQALEHGLAVNLGGGYHHAKPSRGEGFCLYADVGVAVAQLRRDRLVRDEARIVSIDTDAHQGNGICHTFIDDNRVFVFDIFNSQIYPSADVDAQSRIDCSIPVTSACTDGEYMEALYSRLPGFLDSVANAPIALAFYNAGTDVYKDDPLGGLSISAATIRQRDLYVVEQLRRRDIPTVMVLSGGYTKQSYQLVVDSVIGLVEPELT